MSRGGARFIGERGWGARRKERVRDERDNQPKHHKCSREITSPPRRRQDSKRLTRPRGTEAHIGTDWVYLEGSGKAEGGGRLSDTRRATAEATGEKLASRSERDSTVTEPRPRCDTHVANSVKSCV